MVSISKGSEAAKSIASTCLSSFVGADGKSIILFFFLLFIYDFLIINLSNNFSCEIVISPSFVSSKLAAASLELTKEGEITISQEKLFDKLMIKKS